MITVILGLFLCGHALAEEPVKPVSRSSIEDGAFAGAVGMIGVNMAAGDGHTQANIREISIGSSLQTVDWTQVSITGAAGPSDASDLIGGSAFSGAYGIISVNQAAGSGNAEFNLFSFQMGGALQEVSDLEQIVGAAHPMKGRDEGVRSDTIGDGAFSGVSGVVQVNQSAGTANAVSNSMSFRCRIH